ncbi:MAG: Xaa-Pro peptidase family protein, partial [bacterium]
MRASLRPRRADANFDYARRLAAVRAGLRPYRLPGLLVTSPLNLRYLSGVADAAWGLVTSGGCSVLPFGLGAEAARRDAAPGWRVLGLGDAWQALRREAARAGVRRLGIEAGALTLDRHDRLRTGLQGDVMMIPTREVVEKARERKDAAVLRLLARASWIAAEAGRQIPFLLRAGLTERAVAAELDREIRALGADCPAFETIELGGSRSALPHGRPGDRPFRAGDLCLADWGAAVDGYHSDCTRVWCLPRETARQRRAYTAVLRAYRAGGRAVRGGRLRAAADTAARAARGP